MIYLVRSNERRGNTRKLWKILGGFFLILIILHLFAPKLLPAIFNSFISPLWQYQSSSPEGVGESRDDLISKIKSLTGQLAETQAMSSTTAILLEENRELKSIMGHISTSTDGDSRILAAVIKRPPQAAYDSLIIDAGSDRHIIEGAEVYAPGGVIIGNVSSVFKKTSTVNLLSTASNPVDVSFGTSTAPISAVGRGGGAYEASVPRDLRIKEGNLATIKKGDISVVGVVDRVVSDPAQPFATVFFSSSVNIYELRWVFVEATI